MTTEFKTLWELQQEGTFESLFEQLANAVKNIVAFPVPELSSGTVSEQTIIGIISLILIGIIFLPFGATESSIKACQSNTNQKVVKLGGALIVAMTSISAIFFLEILDLTQTIGSIY